MASLRLRIVMRNFKLVLFFLGLTLTLIHYPKISAQETYEAISPSETPAPLKGPRPASLISQNILQEELPTNQSTFPILGLIAGIMAVALMAASLLLIL